MSLYIYILGKISIILSKIKILDGFKLSLFYNYILKFEKFKFMPNIPNNIDKPKLKFASDWFIKIVHVHLIVH